MGQRLRRCHHATVTAMTVHAAICSSSLNHAQLALLLFSQFSAAVVRHKSKLRCSLCHPSVSVVQVRYRTVWSGISSYRVLAYPLQHRKTIADCCSSCSLDRRSLSGRLLTDEAVSIEAATEESAENSGQRQQAGEGNQQLRRHSELSLSGCGEGEGELTSGLSGREQDEDFCAAHVRRPWHLTVRPCVRACVRQQSRDMFVRVRLIQRPTFGYGHLALYAVSPAQRDAAFCCYCCC